jgi:hypothetical protein
MPQRFLYHLRIKMAHGAGRDLLHRRAGARQPRCIVLRREIADQRRHAIFPTEVRE